MTSEVWKIGKETQAQDYYKDIKQNGLNGMFMLKSEAIAVNQLTKVCQEMINAYEEVIDDQNEYMFDIDEMVSKAEDTANDIRQRIEELEKEVAELTQKQEDGTITDEEKGELSAKSSELKYLQGLAEKTNEDNTKEIKDKNEERKSEYRSKEKIATDYGETTVEKGTPLAETKVKGGFFRKLFGTTGKHKKEVGERAVKTGNELLDKVSDSSKIEEKIDKKVNAEK